MDEHVGTTIPAGAARNLIVATLAFLICFTSWGVVSPLARRLQTDLNLSDTKTAILLAVPVLCGSILRLPAGVLADRFGGRLMFTLIMLLSAIPAVFLGYAASFWSIAVLGFLLGAAGAAFAIGVPFVAGWWKGPRIGLAVGVYGMGTIGTALAALLVPRISNAWGHVYVGWGMAILLVAGAAMVWMLSRDAPGPRVPTRYGEVWKAGWRLHRLSLMYFVTFGGFVAMTVFLPKLLTDWFDLGAVDAGQRAAGFAALAVAARPLGGWLSDRFGGGSVLVISFAGVAIDAAVLASIARAPDMTQVTIACLTMGVFLGLGSGAVFKIVPHDFPEATGAVTGIVGAVGGLGGFLPPLFMGIAKDTFGNYAAGFIGLMLFASICLLVTMQIQREELTGAIIRQEETNRGEHA